MDKNVFSKEELLKKVKEVKAGLITSKPTN